jgi:hypothetical protein
MFLQIGHQRAHATINSPPLESLIATELFISTLACQQDFARARVRRVAAQQPRIVTARTKPQRCADCHVLVSDEANLVNARNESYHHRVTRCAQLLNVLLPSSQPITIISNININEH